MSRTMIRGLAGAIMMSVATPSLAWAHPGHAGDHGWLFGAIQPLLGLDHFLAGLFVAGVGAIGFAVVGRVRRGEGARGGRQA